MPSTENPFSIEPISLDPEERIQYEQTQKGVEVILHAGPGDRLMYLLNAIALSSSEALETMNIWSELALNSTTDPRDIVSLIHDRPLSLPAIKED